MQSIIKNKAIKRSALLIGLVSILQPYIVLGTQYGPSNECWGCFIIEQTFLTSLLYLLLPLITIYLVTKRLGINSILQGLLIVAYFTPVSFVKLTVPLFDDRIAAWSTFTEREIWSNAMFMAIPSMGFLSCFILVVIVIINREASMKTQHELLDEMKDADNAQ